MKKLIEHDNDLGHINGISTFSDSVAGTKKTIKKRSNSDVSENSSKGKKKILKKKGLTNSLNKNEFGHPIYPISIDNVTVYNFGEIIYDKSEFHTEYVIYPVGYTVTRIYGQLHAPEKKCTYTCRILSNGDSPLFQIIPDADSKLAITGPSPDHCYRELLKFVNKATQVPIEVKPRMGDHFFGLFHPVISEWIQSSPNAKHCINFNPIKTEGGLMENDNDPSLNYDALQCHMAISSYHTVPEIKEEPPDELLELSDINSFTMT